MKGICKEFYYKNGYLYICSSNVDQLSGYVTQINLKTYSIIKEYEIDFVPYSIVIDQRNNVILSSEKQSYIKYLDMKTGNISSICECMEKDRIIYNEDEDIFILVGRNRKKEEKIYKYDSLTNQFKLSNKQ